MLRSKWFWIGVSVVGCLLLLTIGGGVWFFFLGEGGVTISKETTHITEPLDENGNVDYVAAINAQYSQGVTPENNAMVVLVRTMAAEDLFFPDEMSFGPEYFRMLGVAQPVDTATRLIGISDFAAEVQDTTAEDAAEMLRSNLGEIQLTPWRKVDHPQLARWMERNEKAFDLLSDASRRSRYYSPVGGEHCGWRISGRMLPLSAYLDKLREAYPAKIMLDVGEGDVDGALETTLVIKRLGRLLQQGPTLVEWLYGRKMEDVANHCLFAVARHCKLNAEQAAEHRRRCEKLPPRQPLANAIGVGERYLFLDMVCCLARGEMELGEIADDLDDRSSFKRGVDRGFATHLVDWDVTLRYGNAWYDRLVAASLIDDPITRRDKIAAVQVDFDAEFEEMLRGGTSDQRWEARLHPRKGFGRRKGVALTSLFLPAAHSLRDIEARTEIYSNLALVELALSVFRTETGDYPESLDELTPKYLQQLPPDLFLPGETFRYELVDGEPKLYAVGPNGIDELGSTDSDDYVLTIDDTNEEPAEDDPHPSDSLR